MPRNRLKPLDLIRINEPPPDVGNNGLVLEVLMPVDAMIFGLVVAVIFVVFAGVLAWGDHQTRPRA
jgi:hypothetical protein